MEGRRLSRPRWLLHTEMVYRLPGCRRSPIQVLTGPGIDNIVDLPNDITTTLNHHRVLILRDNVYVFNAGVVSDA